MNALKIAQSWRRLDEASTALLASRRRELQKCPSGCEAAEELLALAKAQQSERDFLARELCAVDMNVDWSRR